VLRSPARGLRTLLPPIGLIAPHGRGARRRAGVSKLKHSLANTETGSDPAGQLDSLARDLGQRGTWKREAWAR